MRAPHQQEDPNPRPHEAHEGSQGVVPPCVPARQLCFCPTLGGKLFNSRTRNRHLTVAEDVELKMLWSAVWRHASDRPVGMAVRPVWNSSDA